MREREREREKEKKNGQNKVETRVKWPLESELLENCRSFRFMKLTRVPIFVVRSLHPTLFTTRMTLNNEIVRDFIYAEEYARGMRENHSERERKIRYSALNI